MQAISVNKVTKDYKIYSQRGQKIKEWMTFNRRQYYDIKRALENISFEVNKGECVGIIGDNGSGKSTILKILAGTSYPTLGSIAIDGRVSYILDVSTGFNLDFTGRENVFTKCALLGLPPEKIEEKYDTIVEFSGLGDRIEHPMKTYSTGMVMRIGFAIAVHLPFDILIVDEVLSVGDYLFQRKCVEALKQIIDKGKTVIITSHSLSDVSSFCNRLILIREGKIALIGETDEVIQAYVEECERRYSQVATPSDDEKVLTANTQKQGSARLLEVVFQDGSGNPTNTVNAGEEFKIEVLFEVEQKIADPCIRVHFLRNDGLLVLGTNTYQHDLYYGEMSGKYQVILHFPYFDLNEGEYFVNVGIWPDELESFATKTPYDLREYKDVLAVQSSREDGGGLVKDTGIWTLKKLPEDP